MKSSLKLKWLTVLSTITAGLALSTLLWMPKTLVVTVIFGIALGLYIAMFFIALLPDRPDES